MPPDLTFFFFNDTATTEIYTLSLHDALPICYKPDRVRQFAEDLQARIAAVPGVRSAGIGVIAVIAGDRSEEHTSELQSPCNLVCRLLLEKKNRLSIFVHVITIPGSKHLH